MYVPRIAESAWPRLVRSRLSLAPFLNPCRSPRRQGQKTQAHIPRAAGSRAPVARHLRSYGAKQISRRADHSRFFAALHRSWSVENAKANLGPPFGIVPDTPRDPSHLIRQVRIRLETSTLMSFAAAHSSPNWLRLSRCIPAVLGNSREVARSFPCSCSLSRY